MSDAEVSGDSTLLGGATVSESPEQTAPTSEESTGQSQQVEEQVSQQANTDQTENGEEDSKKESESKEPEVAPESYEDFTLPEGFTIDSALADEFKTLAGKDGLNLTQAQAQKLVDFQTSIIEKQSKATLDAFKAQTESWKSETIKALGNDHEKEIGFAAKAIDQFGGKELREILDQTGLGNHPAIAKAFVQIGKTISEDTFRSGDVQNQKLSDAQLFFGKK